MSQPQNTFEQIVQAIEKSTQHLYPMWMMNTRENVNLAKDGDSLDKIFARPAVNRALIVGRGPSLLKYRHPQLLCEHPFPGVVVSSDGALPLLQERGIYPNFSVTVDGSPIIEKWYQNPAVMTEAIMPITAHPATVKAAMEKGYHLYWFIPELDSGETKRGITEILQMMTLGAKNTTGISRLNGAGCSGLCSFVFAAIILRAKEIVLVGMDNGYPHDTPLPELHYHHKILESCGYDPNKAASCYSIVYSKDWDQYCIVDPVFESYRRCFEGLAAAAKQMGIKIINCTEGGCLVADGVSCLPLEAYLSEAMGA